METTMLPPLSPISQFINTPVLTIYVLAVCEFEIPFSRAQGIQLLQNDFAPLSKRLSSVIVSDKKGVHRWKEVECKVEDHLVVPTFPEGLSPKEYDVKLENYISDIYVEQLPENRPPWELHMFNYPTTNAAAQTILFKLNHALGDGYSFMAALITKFKAADIPSVPLKFPKASSRLSGAITSYSRASDFVYKCINTFTDLARGVLGMQDDDTVLRSKTPMVEYAPVNISSVTFSLDQLREVKCIIGKQTTVNDVTTGILSYALQLYTKKKGQKPRETRTTALIIFNLRMLTGFKTIEEMLKAKIWGNHSAYLVVSLPSFGDVDNVDPLEYVSRSKSEIKRKINSMAAYLTPKILNMLASLRGPEAASEYVRSVMRNSTTTISNMIGPAEKASLAGHPLKGFYFTVPGIPQPRVYYSKLHGESKNGGYFRKRLY